MLRQWNSRSELWVTTFSVIRAAGFSAIQRVTTVPSSSRSLAFVAVKTFAPIMAFAPWYPVRPVDSFLFARDEHVKEIWSGRLRLWVRASAHVTAGLDHQPGEWSISSPSEERLETLLGRPLE